MGCTILGAIAVVIRDHRVLICQRKAGDSFGGCWEFPGGGLEIGETLTDCLHRELREELALTVEILSPLTPVSHTISEGRLILHPYLCRPTGPDPIPIECDQLLWIDPADLNRYPFPPGNESLFAEINARLNNGSAKTTPKPSP